MGLPPFQWERLPPDRCPEEPEVGNEASLACRPHAHGTSFHARSCLCVYVYAMLWCVDAIETQHALLPPRIQGLSHSLSLAPSHHEPVSVSVMSF